MRESASLSRFGVQRPAGDVATLILLFAGFGGLAVAFWMLTDNWAGLLLPLGFLFGIWSGLRAEVREIELLEDALLVRTFFRSYRMPRAHITKVIVNGGATFIQVLNGKRYLVTPPEAEPAAVARALESWLGTP